MNKKISKKFRALLMLAVMLAAFTGSIMQTSAATVSTSEFGTFTYTLTRSGSTVTAYTAITKKSSSNYLVCKLDVENNATGALLYRSGEIRETRYNNLSVIARNLGTVKLAAFTTHEARGQGSIARYLASTF